MFWTVVCINSLITDWNTEQIKHCCHRFCLFVRSLFPQSSNPIPGKRNKRCYNDEHYNSFVYLGGAVCGDGKTKRAVRRRTQAGANAWRADNIPGRLLKEEAIELSPIFTLLFNSTLHQGKIPSPWKQAHVAPVHKKNSRHDPANYRPISLTSVTCKIIEHFIYSQVINHLDSNGILTDKQFGFRKRHSCETQLLITVQDLAQGLRDKQEIDAVILDFSKAFDKVSHRRLLLKLEHYMEYVAQHYHGLATSWPTARRE